MKKHVELTDEQVCSATRQQLAEAYIALREHHVEETTYLVNRRASEATEDALALTMEWRRGMADAVKIVEQRLSNAEIYRDGVAMRTKPEVFATLDEVLIFLRAALERGTRRSLSQLDGAT
jgi:hypothetical protein